MPNHITTILKASSDVLQSLRSEDKDVDFNTVIPMPDDLNVTSGSDDTLVKFIFGDLKDDGSVLSSLQLRNTLRGISDGGLSKFDQKRFDNFIALLQNRYKYGYTSWYEFCNDKWGTKWNAYEAKEVEGGVQFQTAWSCPLPVIEALSAKFPDAEIEVLWADEDIGSNLGHVFYRGGSIERTVPVEDPIDFALTVTGSDREYYRKGTNGKWEYYDADEGRAEESEAISVAERGDP